MMLIILLSVILLRLIDPGALSHLEIEEGHGIVVMVRSGLSKKSERLHANGQTGVICHCTFTQMAVGSVTPVALAWT